jgi:hypothetical protein
MRDPDWNRRDRDDWNRRDAWPRRSSKALWAILAIIVVSAVAVLGKCIGP